MQEKHVDNLLNRTKNCFVLLERLDKTTLDRCLRKKDSDPVSIAKQHRKRGKRRPRSAKPSSKTADESPQKNCFKRRRKIRAKPLYYTEDEDEYANPKENIPDKTTADNLSPHLPNEHPKAEIGANHHGTMNGSKKMNGTELEKRGLISASFLKHSSNKTAVAVMQPESDVRPSEALSQKAIQKFPEKTGKNDRDDSDLCSVKKEDEVEVADELRELGSFKMELKWDEEDQHLDCTSAQMQELEYEENESRDEDEDDRATVVFEGNFDEEETHFEEAFEKAEERTGSVTKKFQKKKMMNRKKKTLVKFKRKRSIIGRNLAKVRKLKGKKSEVRGSAEKESDSERNVGEVCNLVKRLHELHRIILQLQKELPMNDEQTDCFIRSLKAQQENFYKEIRKSEKTIMNGYDKMLSSFGNASSVSMEIGRRTSLSKEDIADVISQCKTETLAANFQEVGPPQPIWMEKSNNEGLDNSFNHIRKNPAPGSGSSDPVMTLHTQSVQSSGHRSPPKSTLRRPNNVPNVAKKVETRENHSTGHFLHGPSNALRGSIQNSSNNQVRRFDVSKPRAHVGPRENFPRRTNVPQREPRFMQFHQQDLRQVHGNQVRPPLLPLPVHRHLSNVRAQYGGSGLPIHRGGTSAVSYHPVNNNNVEFFQVLAPPAPLMAEPAPRVCMQSLMDVNPFPFGFPQGRLPPQQFPQVQNPSVRPNVRLASKPHFDRPKHGNAPAQANRIQNNFSHSAKSFNNFQRSNGFPSSKSSEDIVSGAPNQSFPKEGQCSLRNLLATFSRFLQTNTPTQTYPVTEPPANLEQTYNLSTEAASKSVALESSVLDPTVPQKLTMRNCRLEAGPVLKPKNESVTSEGGEKPCQGQDSISGGAEALNQKELNSRVYVCAQNGCKNPGVRICKGCLSVIYCSETCQLKHWTVKHKTECHQLRELRG